ncbi:TetR/AcrR family transcriptional regulator [Mycobacterium sp. 21AC1]|uniref:TetR/AcrR family transcriptional regulator n=1 Tax=[Mycobacterium] appelbergii TaxID=2939269 RepID=UPI0029393AD1|nr:TetR/AcrR family transcriptional regulator [Mycobacterium sp. 21AC1]MDV3123889.1 TetR/AcrR family transcriptional regulator [Mycobacterium sp. 21AC1]
MKRRPATSADAGDTRARILDGALQLAAITGLRKFSMEEIARQAKIGRATLYLYFKGRDALISAVVQSELARYFDGIQVVVDQYDDTEDRLVHGFGEAYRLLRHHPALSTILRVNPELLRPYLIAENSEALNLARGFVDSTIVEDEIPESARAPFAEHLSRAIHSLILIPGGVLNIDSPNGPEDYARRFLLPVLRAMRTELATARPDASP